MPWPFAATFASFRHRNYRLFFLGQTISLVGSWMQAVAQGWLVLLLSDSAFILGLVGVLNTLPLLLFSFWGGVVADQVDKRRLLLVTNTAGLLLALLLGLLTATGWIAIWQVLILTFLAGTYLAFDIPGRQSFIIQLVGKDDLPNAIALNSSLFNATRALGPAVAGVLIASVGLANCFFLNALSFVAPLICLSLMRLPARPQPENRPGVWQGARELLGYLYQHLALGWLLFLVASNAVLALSYTVLLPMIARDVLHSGPRGYGFLMTANGLGAFLGALVLATFIRRQAPMRFFLGGTGLMLLSLALFGWSRWYLPSWLCLFGAGFGMTVHISVANSLLQLNVPDQLRGRVMSLLGLAFLGFMPLGNFLYGVLGEHLGPLWAVRLGTGAAIILTTLVVASRRELRDLNFP